MKMKAKDNTQIYVHVWNDVDEVKGVVQIFHGMSEHAKRYEEFAKFLNAKGFVVYADDHRGHGLTSDENGKDGFLGEDGFYRIVEDEWMLTTHLKQKFKGKPIFIFGHSFGSFLGQEYLLRYSSEVDGIILCGSAFQKGVAITVAKYLAKFYATFYGEEKRADLLDHLAFSSYNKKIANANSFDWLTRDPNVVARYREDKKCGFVCTANFYRCLSEGFSGLYKTKRMQNANKNIPIFIISGLEDPVGAYGKSVRSLEQNYKSQGFANVNMMLYENARHELLNELNKDEVMRNVLSWMENVIREKNEVKN